MSIEIIDHYDHLMWKMELLRAFIHLPIYETRKCTGHRRQVLCIVGTNRCCFTLYDDFFAMTELHAESEQKVTDPRHALKQ